MPFEKPSSSSRSETGLSVLFHLQEDLNTRLEHAEAEVQRAKAARDVPWLKRASGEYGKIVETLKELKGDIRRFEEQLHEKSTPKKRRAA